MNRQTPPNLERRELRAHGVRAENRVRFKLNSKRAHPPIPPRGRALTLRPRELEARARFKFAVEIGNGSFPADERRRRPREQQPRETDFLSAVRSAFAARQGHTTSLSGGGPTSVRFLSDVANGPQATTFARVAAGPGLATAPTARTLGHTAQRRPTWAKWAQFTHDGARIGLDSRLQGGNRHEGHPTTHR